ncbi:MAG: DNA translocase FtsK [Synergistaceae bacterium]|nr:DNA translocase FtsK [Synergistaceae bacterium]
MGLFRKKKPVQDKQPVKNRKKAKKPTGSVLSLWFEVFIFLILAFLVYTAASLFSLRTGAWGAQIRFSLLQNWGGAILIPLLLGLYLCVLFFLKAGRGGLMAQIFGTFLLFLAASLLLGLFHLAGLFSGLPLLAPGYLGEGLAVLASRNIGAFGSILLTAALLVLSATLFGFLNPGAIIGKVSRFLKAIGSDGWKRMPYPESPKGVPQPQPEEPKKYSAAEKNEEEVIEEKIEEKKEYIFSLENDQEVVDFPPFLKEKPEEPQDAPEGDPHALPEIEFNEIDGSEKKVRGGTFPPPLDIFGPRQQADSTEDTNAVKEQSESIITTLADFGVTAEMADIVIGPTVIQFQMQLAPGIKVSKVAGLSNDLAVALTVPSLRVEAPIPGKPYVGVEIPNPKRRGISIRTIVESTAFQDNEYDLPLAMGVRVDSRPLVVGLEDLPHLLVAGTTGSGKSVFVTSCITGLCTSRTPEELRFILIDPKRVELSIYEHLPHVLAKPVVSPKKAVQALAWAVREMEHRYEIFARARVRNLKSYNQCVLPKAKLPSIVIVVDELADLMFTAQKDVEDYICRLAQMARATGIHLILATQRPSVNVITGLIKANVPARVAFTLPSQTDSRTIIDVSGAERLLGKGDMLFVSSRYPRPLRMQSPFIDDGKSSEIIAYLRNVFGDPEYVDIEDQGGDTPAGGDTSFADDPLLEEAADIVFATGIASASRLQRQLRVGFTRAARLIDTMEQLGIVGPPEGSKPREILVDDESARGILQRACGGARDA